MRTLKNIMGFSLLMIGMMFLLNGCVSVSFSNGYTEKEHINGKGDVITKEYAVSEYSSVRIDADVAVVYTAADSDIVKMEMQENLFEYLDISVVDGQLIVLANRQFVTSDHKTPILYIDAPTLDTLVIDGLVEIKESDSLKSSEFHLLVAGSLNGHLDVDTDDLVMELDGLGDIALSGMAAQATIIVGGAATVDALELDTKDSTVELDGAGTISLSCSDTLNIVIDGAGSVNYRGTPSLQQAVSGLGSVKQIAD